MPIGVVGQLGTVADTQATNRKVWRVCLINRLVERPIRNGAFMTAKLTLSADLQCQTLSLIHI